MASRSRWDAVLWVSLCLASVVGSVGLLNDFPVFGWTMHAAIAIGALRASRPLPALSLVLLFDFLFVLYAIPHVFLGMDIAHLQLNDGLPYLTQALWAMSLFLSVIVLWLGSIPAENQRPIVFEELIREMEVPKSREIFYLLMGVLVVATLFGIRGEVVLGVEGNYGAYVETLQTSSGLQEYMLVPFFISALVLRGRFQKLVWFAVLAIFVAKLSLVGLRVVALMGMVMGVWMAGVKLSFRSLLVIFAAGFVLVSLLGILKGTVAGDEMFESLFFERQGDILVSHHGNVLSASSAILRLIDQGIIDGGMRIQLLFYYLANSLIPSRLLQEALGRPSLGVWLQEQSYTSGGGHAAVYAYAAGGPLAVIALASMLGWALRHTLSARRDLLSSCAKCWLMMVLVTFPRWLSYDIGNFYFRLPFYAVLLFAILKLPTYWQSARGHVNR